MTNRNDLQKFGYALLSLLEIGLGFLLVGLTIDTLVDGHYVAGLIAAFATVVYGAAFAVFVVDKRGPLGD